MSTSDTIVGDRDAEVATVTGEERAAYLDAVLTQRLRDAAPGTVTSALELGPHGEPMGVLDLLVEHDRIVLVVPQRQPEDVVGRLAARTFLTDATFEREPELRVLRIRGADPYGVAAAAGAAVTPGTATTHLGASWLGFHHGVDVLVPAPDRDSVLAALAEHGASTADAAALDAAEVAAGVPRAPDEIALGRLPEEMGLLPTHVHLDKGCYPGQEAVARMWMLGKPRRRLARVALADDVEIGRQGEGSRSADVTRIVEVDGERIGLAFVPAGTSEHEDVAEGITVLGFVGDGLPVPGHDPAVTRRRDRPRPS